MTELMLILISIQAVSMAAIFFGMKAIIDVLERVEKQGKSKYPE